MPPSDWPCSTTTRRASPRGSAAPAGASAGSATTRGAVPLITTGAGFDGPPAQAATRPANAITDATRIIPYRAQFCSTISRSLPSPDAQESYTFISLGRTDRRPSSRLLFLVVIHPIVIPGLVLGIRVDGRV